MNNQNQIKSQAAKLLRQVERGPGKGLGTELFDAVALHSVSCAFEGVALRRNNQDSKLWIYLKQRAANDTAYPGQWHCPGSIRRPYEKWIDVATRLSQREFKAGIATFRGVGRVLVDEERGSFISFVFLVDLQGELDQQDWYPVDKLPQPMVKVHEEKIIPLGVAAYEAEEANKRLQQLKACFCEE